LNDGFNDDESDDDSEATSTAGSSVGGLGQFIADIEWNFKEDETVEVDEDAPFSYILVLPVRSLVLPIALPIPL
jgi:hypothetical protein